MKSPVIAMFVAVVCFLAFTQKTVWAEHEGKITIPEVKSKMNEAIKSAQEYTAQQKDAYVKELEAKLHDLSQRVDRLEEKVREAKGQVRSVLESKITDLREKQAAAEKRLQELKSASSKAWVEMKGGLEMALAIVEESYRKALDRLK